MGLNHCAMFLYYIILHVRCPGTTDLHISWHWRLCLLSASHASILLLPCFTDRWLERCTTVLVNNWAEFIGAAFVKVLEYFWPDVLKYFHLVYNLLFQIFGGSDNGLRIKVQPGWGKVTSMKMIHTEIHHPVRQSHTSSTAALCHTWDRWGVQVHDRTDFTGAMFVTVLEYISLVCWNISDLYKLILPFSDLWYEWPWPWAACNSHHNDGCVSSFQVLFLLLYWPDPPPEDLPLLLPRS